ncbi:MAG: FkbM family methyltransferase [Planctomycetota bacterium]
MEPQATTNQGDPDAMLRAIAAKFGAIDVSVQTNALLLADTRRRVARLEALASLAAANRKATMPVLFQSQFGEDALVWSLLDGQLDGFFIEVGAFDGWNYSTTYAFEAIGWKGLLIEAIPERCEVCRKGRAGSRVVNAALSRRGSAGDATFTIVQDHYGGMLSYNTTTPDHLGDLRQGGFRTRPVTVPLTSMDALLEGHKGEIDFASIDVEGGEADVLDGFDLDRWKPKVLLIEDNNRNNAAVRAHMQRFPYRFAGWLFVNAVYVRTDQPMVMRRAMELLTP